MFTNFHYYLNFNTFIKLTQVQNHVL